MIATVSYQRRAEFYRGLRPAAGAGAMTRCQKAGPLALLAIAPGNLIRDNLTVRIEALEEWQLGA